MHWLNEYGPRSVGKTHCCCTICDTRKSIKLTWAKVRQVLHGRKHNRELDVAGIDASILNNHYAAISKDHCYTKPRTKLSVQDSHSLISEMDVFYMLDRLIPTGMGLDAVPAWFLQMVRQLLLLLLPSCSTNPCLLMWCHSNGNMLLLHQSQK